ncbi:hypothetical protein C8F04DRAFT_1187593 [Mycena alexandri]|uniref:Uncharacterized protein n=1 Tax=Mycena alexandri TaxID=1745969 RepID=A0AAD6WYQ0_9AGAR|nr:hypothetical protein C8F04DRAFT_1187593 [Mycena alexandri]
MHPDSPQKHQAQAATLESAETKKRAHTVPALTRTLSRFGVPRPPLPAAKTARNPVALFQLLDVGVEDDGDAVGTEKEESRFVCRGVELVLQRFRGCRRDRQRNWLKRAREASALWSVEQGRKWR